MAEQPAGPILDGLGVTIDLDDGDLVETALVLSKVITAEGEINVYLSDGMSWLDQLALITAAQRLVNDRHQWHLPHDDHQ